MGFERNDKRHTSSWIANVTMLTLGSQLANQAATLSLPEPTQLGLSRRKHQKRRPPPPPRIPQKDLACMRPRRR